MGCSFMQGTRATGTFQMSSDVQYDTYLFDIRMCSLVDIGSVICSGIVVLALHINFTINRPFEV